MKISPSNLGLWPRCLFEFISGFFLSPCTRFIMQMQRRIKIVWDAGATVFTGTRWENTGGVEGPGGEVTKYH